ncbi:hypothetical protein LY76DRAFT_356650 [Colletotrichum caudatum]|nr:hypothetical protein LY76DRAFT_356650 [Colletotrichum caudatum]
MDHDPSLLLQTPDHWPLWPELDASSSDCFAFDDLNREPLASDFYPSQPTPDLMVANLPPSTSLGPDVSLALGFKWYIDLTTNNAFNTPTSYNGSNRHFGVITRDYFSEQSHLSIVDNSPFVSPPSLMTNTQPSRISHNSTHQQTPHPSSFQVHLIGDPKPPRANKTRKQQPEANITDATVHQSKSPPPINSIASKPSISIAQRHQSSHPPICRGYPHPVKKRPHYATLNVSLSSTKAGGLGASASAAQLSRKYPQAASRSLSQVQLPTEKPSLATAGQRSKSAHRPSASHQQRTRVDRAARLRSKPNVTRSSVSISEYQLHVMNLIESIKRESVSKAK